MDLSQLILSVAGLFISIGAAGGGIAMLIKTMANGTQSMSSGYQDIIKVFQTTQESLTTNNKSLQTANDAQQLLLNVQTKQIADVTRKQEDCEQEHIAARLEREQCREENQRMAAALSKLEGRVTQTETQLNGGK